MPTSQFTYPSPLVELKLESEDESRQFSWAVTLPQNELHRIESIFRNGEYLLPNPQAYDRPLICVDIGANVGLFALFLKSFFPTSIIHCFEPVPATFALLRKNTSSVSNIFNYEWGCSNINGQVPIYLHAENHGANSIKAIPNAGSQSVEIELREVGAEFDRLNLSHIDILKVDTEGCEVEIFENLGPRLTSIDHVMLEYHTEPDRRHLDTLLQGFVLYHSKVHTLGSGVLGYVNSRLLTPQPHGKP